MITKERLLEILDKSKPEDKLSFYAEITLSSLIILNLLAVSLESVPSLSKQYSNFFLYFEVFSVISFRCLNSSSSSIYPKTARRAAIIFDCARA